jgi:hypothetical protein
MERLGLVRLVLLPAQSNSSKALEAESLNLITLLNMSPKEQVTFVTTRTISFPPAEGTKPCSGQERLRSVSARLLGRAQSSFVRYIGNAREEVQLIFRCMPSRPKRPHWLLPMPSGTTWSHATSRFR